MNISQLINHYASSVDNPPKGYGSIDKGIKVNAYRKERMRAYLKQGVTDYSERKRLAQIDVINKYGNPV